MTHRIDMILPLTHYKRAAPDLLAVFSAKMTHHITFAVQDTARIRAYPFGDGHPHHAPAEFGKARIRPVHLFEILERRCKLKLLIEYLEINIKLAIHKTPDQMKVVSPQIRTFDKGLRLCLALGQRLRIAIDIALESLFYRAPFVLQYIELEQNVCTFGTFFPAPLGLGELPLQLLTAVLLLPQLLLQRFDSTAPLGDAVRRQTPVYRLNTALICAHEIIIDQRLKHILHRLTDDSLRLGRDLLQLLQSEKVGRLAEKLKQTTPLFIK
jgi:hypothetical protein